MGTTSTKKFLKNVNGSLHEESALTTSAGSSDADKIPALNAAGILDDSILNASATKAADTVVKSNADGVIDPSILNAADASTGAGDAGKLAQLGEDGRLSETMMPAGFGQDAASITASESLSAGDFVNIWNNGGPKVRKADASVAGKEAHGFVLSSVASGSDATVFFEGTNTGVTGQTPGLVFLSATAGQATGTAPSGTGKVVQRIGYAISATAVNFNAGETIVLA